MQEKNLVTGIINQDPGSQNLSTLIRKDVLLHVLNKHTGEFLTVDRVLAGTGGTVDAMDAATMRAPFEDTTFLQAVCPPNGGQEIEKG